MPRIHGSNLAYASSAYGTDQASPELIGKMQDLKDSAFTKLDKKPPDSAFRGAMGYMINGEQTLYLKSGSKVGFLRDYVANDGYGNSSDSWTRVDFGKTRTKADRYPEVASFAKETWQAGFMASTSLKSYFAEPGTKIPDGAKKALAAAERKNPRYESGVIRDSWQGKFDFFTVVSYDKKTGAGTGTVFGPSGNQIGAYTMTPKTRDTYGD